MRAGLGVAAGIALLALAACTPRPGLDPDTFSGGVLRVAHGVAAGEDVLLFVNPDGTLAGAGGGADSVEDFAATRTRLAFSAEVKMASGAIPMRFDLPAASFGPDYAGTVTIGGGCAADCTGDATAWWASGNHKVTLPR